MEPQERYEALIHDLVAHSGGSGSFTFEQYQAWVKTRPDLTPEERAVLTLTLAEQVVEPSYPFLGADGHS